MPGRKEGATNLKKREFRHALFRYCADKNVDPFYWMVDLLAKKGVKRALKLQAAQELAQYLHPKRTSMRLSGAPEPPVTALEPRRASAAPGQAAPQGPVPPAKA
jgi:hypothetical protein